jgi:hypothetical protein
MRNATTRVLALVACTAFAGCSGGGGSSPHSALPSTGATQPPSSTSAKKATVSIVFTAPTKTKGARVKSAGKHLDYISPATLGAVITATSTSTPANDATFGFDLSSNNPSCVYQPEGGATNCTITFPLALDSYSIEIDTYDADDAGLPANLGTELSTQMLSETVSASATANIFTFNPSPFVAGFCLSAGTLGESEDNDCGEDEDAAVRHGASARNAAAIVRHGATSSRHGAALQSPAPGFVAGGEGGFSETEAVVAQALDRDGYAIYSYPGLAPFVNGTFTVSSTFFGDQTGCSPAQPCGTAANSNGTPATVSMADDTENLTVSYSGGGGPGAGIESWTTGNSPTGQAPFYADFSLPDPSSGAVTPYTVPHNYVAPLFGYSTDGNGNPATTSDGSNLYVWAAQALIPTFANPDGSGYAASFSGSSTCVDTNSNAVMEVAGSTYYAGYGAVFTVAVTPDVETSCPLTLTDGVGDAVTVTLTAAQGAPAGSHGRAPSAHAISRSR